MLASIIKYALIINSSDLNGGILIKYVIFRCVKYCNYYTHEGGIIDEIKLFNK